MEITVRRREGHVSERLRVFATHKLERLPRFMSSITTVDVELYEDGSPKATGVHVAELTVATSGPVFRSKGTASDPRASIDMAVERLERRMKEFKRRRSGRPAHANSRPKAISADTSPASPDVAEDELSEFAAFDLGLDDDQDEWGGAYEDDEIVSLDGGSPRSTTQGGLTEGRAGGRGGSGGDQSD
jgi:putative sigma-54 modulation protein